MFNKTSFSCSYSDCILTIITEFLSVIIPVAVRSSPMKKVFFLGLRIILGIYLLTFFINISTAHNHLSTAKSQGGIISREQLVQFVHVYIMNPHITASDFVVCSRHLLCKAETCFFNYQSKHQLDRPILGQQPTPPKKLLLLICRVEFSKVDYGSQFMVYSVGKVFNLSQRHLPESYVKLQRNQTQ